MTRKSSVALVILTPSWSKISQERIAPTVVLLRVCRQRAAVTIESRASLSCKTSHRTRIEGCTMKDMSCVSVRFAIWWIGFIHGSPKAKSSLSNFCLFSHGTAWGNLMMRSIRE